MRVPSPDITKALLAELKTLREKHAQFQARVKTADNAARARDDEARKKIKVLMQRIVLLENDLKDAKESMEVPISSQFVYMVVS